MPGHKSNFPHGFLAWVASSAFNVVPRVGQRAGPGAVSLSELVRQAGLRRTPLRSPVPCSFNSGSCFRLLILLGFLGNPPLSRNKFRKITLFPYSLILYADIRSIITERISMIDQNPKLSKSDTKLLLRYATAHDQAQNIARLIGAAPARISEGKKGEWQLSQESAEILYREYGHPRGSSGIYLVSEVWTSLQEVIETTEQVFLSRQWQRISEALKSKQMRGILEKCFLPYEKHFIYDRFNFDQSATLIERLFNFISDSSLQQWYRENRYIEEARGHTKRIVSGYEPDGLFLGSDGMTSLTDIDTRRLLSKHGLHFTPTVRDSFQTDVWIFLLFLCELSLFSDDRLLLGNNELEIDLDRVVSDEICKKERQVECVVVGEKVWQRESWLKKDFSHEDPQFFKGLGDISSKYVAFPGGCEKIMEAFPEKFNFVDLYLVINKDLEYHLIVSLKWMVSLNVDYPIENRESFGNLDNGDFLCIRTRDFLVKDVVADEILDTILKLAEWLQIEDIGLPSLKSEIAINGGYVAGAQYI